MAGRIVSSQIGDSKNGGSPEAHGAKIVDNNVRIGNSSGKIAEAGIKELNGSSVEPTGTRGSPPRGGPRHKVVVPAPAK